MAGSRRLASHLPEAPRRGRVFRASGVVQASNRGPRTKAGVRGCWTRGGFLVDEPGASSPDIVDRAYQEWLEASRILDSALQGWLEARRASAAAAACYRMALARHSPHDLVEAPAHQSRTAA